MLNLNHNAYSIFPRIHVKCESMALGTKVHFNFDRAQSMDFTPITVDYGIAKDVKVFTILSKFVIDDYSLTQNHKACFYISKYV